MPAESETETHTETDTETGADAVRVTVVGIGADGWPGLSPASRSAVTAAAAVAGGPRQLALLPAAAGGRRVPLPSPLLPGLPGLIAAESARAGRAGLVMLASGDPMFYGIGSTVVRLLGADQVRVLPHPSSVSLAAARLGWPLDDTDVVSVVGRPLALLHPVLQPGRRVLALVAEQSAAADVRALLTARGFGASPVTVLADLGGPGELVALADGRPHSRLAILAIDCRPDPAVAPLPRVPGLPDDAFEHDGQLTKREIRAVALAVLGPVPGQLLWDVGAGSGSVGIEWMRVHPASRALAIEPRADRRDRIARNAAALGVPGLTIVPGAAPAALAGLPAPDAVFVGGGVTADGALAACWAALPAAGRLVANAVTLEGEAVLAEWRRRHGGTLTRIGLERAGRLGSFTTWRPALPVVQWAIVKEEQ
ncbi:MAG TPA: precorrin-6y C5,15-methyltransferase (decarboxylating) subunit CbiE [Trebonia sp.]|nr:precorrin-6y C5,15-methyltransferase (decarboxylating) subunit CbiE [Trebonia sp.]